MCGYSINLTTAKLAPAPHQNSSTDEALEFKVDDNDILAKLCGPLESHIAHLEIAFDTQLIRRGNTIFISNATKQKTIINEILKFLHCEIVSGKRIEISDVDIAIKYFSSNGVQRSKKGLYGDLLNGKDAGKEFTKSVEILTKNKPLIPKTDLQNFYLKLLLSKEVIFGIGPAGTGKTYLSIAAGVSQFLKGKVERIILTRPAVEAGEHLGFLPGDIKDKVDPYMQPLYDSLYDFLPSSQVAKMIDSGKIQVIPLAFMRGRTLANSFIILDEAQNTTKIQMKMFLTRLGQNSQMVITGDLTQIDLGKPSESGLLQAFKVLRKLPGIGFAIFESSDIVRHALVEKIVLAYNEKKL